MGEHTPTPWKLGIFYESDWQEIDSKHYPLPVASCHHFGSRGNKDNAAFIIRACNNHDRLTRENEAMRKALEPFAHVVFNENCRDEISIMGVARGIDHLTIGHLRAAAAAFALKDSSDGR